MNTPEAVCKHCGKLNLVPDVPESEKPYHGVFPPENPEPEPEVVVPDDLREAYEYSSVFSSKGENVRLLIERIGRAETEWEHMKNSRQSWIDHARGFEDALVAEREKVKMLLERLKVLTRASGEVMPIVKQHLLEWHYEGPERNARQLQRQRDELVMALFEAREAITKAGSQ